VVAQKLLPTIRDTPKRVPIVEIMIMNPTIKKLILEERDEKLFDAIRIGKEEGMQLFNDSLYYFVTNEYISRATAFEVSPNVEQLKMQLKGIDVKQPGIL
jgi:twitching motility protein PilT